MDPAGGDGAMRRRFLGYGGSLVTIAAALVLGYLFGATEARLVGQSPTDDPDRMHLRQSPGAVATRAPSDWGLGEDSASKLKPYPPGGPGVRTPLDLWRYAGRGDSSWG